MNALLQDIDDALDHPRRRRLLRIPPALADEFAMHDAERERERIVAALVIGTGILVIQLALDWLIVPDVYTLHVFLRLVLGAPFGLLAIYTVRHHTRTPLQHKLVGSGFAVWCSLICSASLMLSDAPGAPIYLTANNVILAFAIMIMSRPFVMNVVVTLAILSIEMLAALFAAWFSPSLFVSVMLVTSALAVPLLYGSWCLDNEQRRYFLAQKRDGIRLQTIAEHRDMLARLAAIDALTGLPNRRGFDAAVAGDIEKADATTPIAAAMIDIDHFKAYNDRYGHPAGDETLRRVGRALEKAGVSQARIGRTGGEEFSMVLVGIQPNTLELVGARLRAAVERLGIVHELNEDYRHVTVSIGLACGYVADGDPAPLFSRADQALYEAKSRGRNRVVIRRCPQHETETEVA